MAFRQWISRCGGGLAGKLITPSPPLPPFSPPLPPRPRLSFVAVQTRGSRPSPPTTPQNHHLAAPVVGTFVPGPVRQAGGSTAPYIEFVDHLARRLRAATCGVFFDAESANGSSRAPRLEREKHENGEIIFDAFCDGEGEGACGRSRASRLERNMFDLPRHAIDINWSEFSSTGDIILSASAPSPALLPLRLRLRLRLRPKFVYGFFLAEPPYLCVTGNCSIASPLRQVGASNDRVGFTVGRSSRPPLPERATGGSRCVPTGVAAWASCHQPDPMRHEIRMFPHLYQQRRCMTSGRGGGGVPPRYGPYLKNGRTILKRPAFLPTQVPDETAAIKHWKSEVKVDGVVHDSCLDATSLLVKFDPEVYLKLHNLIEAVPVLGEPSGIVSWKITEEGKYTTKSLIDLIGTFHDMGYCIAGLSIDSLVINSAGKFELIEGKVKFTVLTEEGVRNDYRTAVSLLEELIVRSMGQDMFDKVPKDILHLFDLMKCDGYEYRYWIQNHVSLLPLGNRSTLFLAFFDYITLYIPNVDTKLKSKVTKYIPYRKLWAIIASSNSYLVEWLKYQDKSGGITVWGSPFQLLYNVRHVIAHRLSLLERGMSYEAEEVENLLHAYFPMLLVNLQGFFWTEKRLSKFNLESFFMDRKVTKPWPRKKSDESK